MDGRQEFFPIRPRLCRPIGVMTASWGVTQRGPSGLRMEHQLRAPGAGARGHVTGSDAVTPVAALGTGSVAEDRASGPKLAPHMSWVNISAPLGPRVALRKWVLQGQKDVPVPHGSPPGLQG